MRSLQKRERPCPARLIRRHRVVLDPVPARVLIKIRTRISCFINRTQIKTLHRLRRRRCAVHIGPCFAQASRTRPGLRYRQRRYHREARAQQQASRGNSQHGFHHRPREISDQKDRNKSKVHTGQVVHSLEVSAWKAVNRARLPRFRERYKKLRRATPTRKSLSLGRHPSSAQNIFTRTVK